MTIRRFKSTKDNTISNAYREDLKTTAKLSNMGASDVAEIFSIYGQASTSSIEKSRILLEFPISEISSKIDSGEIPSSNVTYKLKLFNCPHSFTTPSNFTISVHPLLQEWTEGTGLDMESYRNLGASNWSSASLNSLWNMEGGPYYEKQDMNPLMITPDLPIECTQTFDSGTENLDIDITKYVEAWRANLKNQGTAASASLDFGGGAGPATANDSFKILRYDGDYAIINFVNGSSSAGTTSGKIVYVDHGASANASAVNLKQALENHTNFNSSINSDKVTITQQAPSFFGNTIVSSSKDLAATVVDFAGGSSLPNMGLLIKMSGSYETGEGKKSYYTKKFFTRTSEFFFKRPIIEAQWDDSIKDDRGQIIKSSAGASGHFHPVSTANKDMNTIYFYNRSRGVFSNIPSGPSGQTMCVQLFSTAAGGSAEFVILSGTAAANQKTLISNFIPVTGVSEGIYKASFAYTGSATSLYDRWFTTTTRNKVDSTSGLFVTMDGFGSKCFATGSAFTISSESSDEYYKSSEYHISITNLKNSYKKEEKPLFRIYTRDKTWSPNIYTKASAQAPINNIKDLYYKIKRSADNLTIIPYVTGSVPNYSSVSYDKNGSFFELDMSLLQSNHMYEISFLYKSGDNFVEQPERFRFRLD